MTETQVFANVVVFIINCCAIAFVCFLISKWVERVEQKIDLLNKLVDTQLNRIETMYVNQLLSLQQMYAATEQYERAAQVQKVIELEVKLQKERNEKNIQD